MTHEYFPICLTTLKVFEQLKLFFISVLDVIACNIILHCRRHAMVTRCKKKLDGRSTKAKSFLISHVG